MVRKLSAALLVLLTVLPFTAPFPSYDLAQATTTSSHGAGHSRLDDGSQALPILAAAGRHRTRIVTLLETLARDGHAATPRPYALPRSGRTSNLAPRTSLTALRI